MASTTRYLFSRVYMCESGQVCMEAANKGCCSTLSFTQRARASSSLSHHHLTRKRRSVRQTWPRLNTHVSRSRPCPRQSFDGRMREKNGGNIVCRYSIEGLPEKRAPLHTSNPCDDVAGLWLRSIYRWKTYVIAMPYASINPFRLDTSGRLIRCSLASSHSSSLLSCSRG